MLTVWRLENNKGLGCYQSSYNDDFQVTDFMCVQHDEDKEHPTPNIDKGILRKPKANEKCGFLNEQQALNWFKHEIKYLNRRGYFIKAMQAKEITAIGEKQILFIR